jgi:hypothetical protein
MITRLFRLPPVVYFILAPLMLALGVYAYVDSNAQDAERRAALSHDAPAPISLQDLKSGDTGSDFNEIVLAAQVDVDNMIELSRERRGRTTGRELFIPLYPTDAADLNGPVSAVIEIDGMVSDEQLGQFYVADGPAAPVFVVNGVLDAGSNMDVGKAFEGRKTVAETVYTVRPFMNGREAGLKPKESGTGLLILGLIVAAVLGGYGFLRKRSLDKAKARIADEPAPEYA